MNFESFSNDSNVGFAGSVGWTVVFDFVIFNARLSDFGSCVSCYITDQKAQVAQEDQEEQDKTFKIAWVDCIGMNGMTWVTFVSFMYFHDVHAFLSFL